MPRPADEVEVASHQHRDESKHFSSSSIEDLEGTDELSKILTEEKGAIAELMALKMQLETFKGAQSLSSERTSSPGMAPETMTRGSSCATFAAADPPLDNKAVVKLELNFEPGKLGIMLNYATGLVQSVDDGEQADCKGVRVGMTCVSVQGEPYSDERLNAALAGSDKYGAVFTKDMESSEAALRMQDLEVRISELEQRLVMLQEGFKAKESQLKAAILEKEHATSLAQASLTKLSDAHGRLEKVQVYLEDMELCKDIAEARLAAIEDEVTKRVEADLRVKLRDELLADMENKFLLRDQKLRETFQADFAEHKLQLDEKRNNARQKVESELASIDGLSDCPGTPSQKDRSIALNDNHTNSATPMFGHTPIYGLASPESKADDNTSFSGTSLLSDADIKDMSTSTTTSTATGCSFTGQQSLLSPSSVGRCSVGSFPAQQSPRLGGSTVPRSPRSAISPRATVSDRVNENRSGQSVAAVLTQRLGQPAITQWQPTRLNSYSPGSSTRTTIAPRIFDWESVTLGDNVHRFTSNGTVAAQPTAPAPATLASTAPSATVSTPVMTHRLASPRRNPVDAPNGKPNGLAHMVRSAVTGHPASQIDANRGRPFSERHSLSSQGGGTLGQPTSSQPSGASTRFMVSGSSGSLSGARHMPQSPKPQTPAIATRSTLGTFQKQPQTPVMSSRSTIGSCNPQTPVMTSRSTIGLNPHTPVMSSRSTIQPTTPIRSPWSAQDSLCVSRASENRSVSRAGEIPCFPEAAEGGGGGQLSIPPTPQMTARNLDRGRSSPPHPLSTVAQSQSPRITARLVSASPDLREGYRSPRHSPAPVARFASFASTTVQSDSGYPRMRSPETHAAQFYRPGNQTARTMPQVSGSTGVSFASSGSFVVQPAPMMVGMRQPIGSSASRSGYWNTVPTVVAGIYARQP